MNDEYSDMNSDGDTYIFQGRFILESGGFLTNPTVRYRTYGALNKERDNCMVVCHALTGNSALDSWWGEMLGPGRLFDTRKFFVVCCNVLGSCYGTTGPTSINPVTGDVYGATFPEVTVRDTVRLHASCLKDGLKISRVAVVVGGSLGGMQALEWALCCGPSFVGCVLTMCCGAEHSPWQIGISESQRAAIYADPKWRNGDYLRFRDPPLAGLSVARQMAMITYRSHKAYSDKFGREEITDESAGNGQGRYFEVERYLRYQGEKFQARFDPLSYIAVTRMMDTHDVGRGRGGVKKALGSISQPVLIISVDSDILYPPCEQEALHRMIPHSERIVIRSDNGHDGFLLDQEVIDKVSKDFLSRKCPGFKVPEEKEVMKASQTRPWGAAALQQQKANL
jgi:homoserine O-acetyltransferase